MEKYNILAAQSGGPTAAINATLAGIIEEAGKSDKTDKIYGAVHGIEGVFNNNIVELNDVNTELLKQTPAAYLGSCRNKLPEPSEDEPIYEKVFSFFREHNIKYFLYIGGNDSMDTVVKLSEYAQNTGEDVKIIGVPKTIDNDLNITDHTPGFGSAAKFIASTVHGIVKDSQVYYLKSVTIVEIMGRNAGWLTAAAALARTDEEHAPHLIYLPESPFSKDKFIADIRELFDKGVNNVIAAVSEGIRDEDGSFVSEDKTGAFDAFGHTSLSGAGKFLENYVKSKIGCKVRSIELNVCQRCAGYMLSETDISESVRIGSEAVKTALSGGTGKMMAFLRVSDSPYSVEIKAVDVSKIANAEKKVDKSYIINGNDVSDKLVNYLRPLIMGEVNLRYKDGIPETLCRKVL